MRKKQKSIKQKNTKRRKRKPGVSRRGKILLSAVAASMLVCTFSVFYVVLGAYDGLGLRRTMETNDYNMEKLYEKNGRLFYEDERYKSLCGIDVSYYQKEIDWEKVAGDGVDFAMIRLGYRGSDSGRLYTDSRFRENLREAENAGISTGVYFFSQAVTTEEATEEAKYVIRRIRGGGTELPVVFDMEPVSGSDRIEHLTSLEKTEIADAFCQIIEKNGYTAMIYGNPSWLSNHLQMEYLTGYPLWIAHYTDVTDYPYEFKMWQYTDRGRVKGIRGKVDMNLLFVKK